MKTFLTPNLFRFTLVTLILAVVFRAALSTSITNKNEIAVAVAALVYAILMFISGSYFGRKDYEYLPVYDIGFRFHLVTFIIHNLISILWFVFAFQSRYESVNIIYITALGWFLFLVLHYVYYVKEKKYAVKNLHKEDLFE